MQKMLAFHHKKGIDQLMLWCTLRNLPNLCLHKSTSAECYPFTETDNDLLQTFREDAVGGPSIIFRRKAVVDETFIRNSTKFVILLTQASYILFLCVSPCEQDYTRDGNMTQILIGLNLNKTNLEALRTWLCHISKDKDLTVKLRRIHQRKSEKY